MKLYLVTDEKACLGRDLFWVVEEAVLGGVTLVQLREKNLGTQQFIEKAIRLKALLEPYKVPLIINDRVDVALAAQADGVHVGQQDLPYTEVKKMLPEHYMLGLSVETKKDVQEAEAWELSYLAVSPLFNTPSKTDTAPAWGMEGLRWVRANSRHPLVGIGGLNAVKAAEAVSQGADGIAVISAICSAESPRRAAQILLKSITNAALNP
ncbi:thiamine phosphate synthase [Arundinibacter roseus]|uniref:Thiamine-phosphate synthase n=1 Tax=Arundinibacter roseus TaxID=2070510 RepID=A0A4R4KIQ1_9BACT|nr:thiamine phosphate synthase [Arundinibacter roseus]TDB68104.1 thiamine phosphate synthase [Arundinibacter roseus]